MKLVTAVIKPFKLEEVREGLADCGVGHYYDADLRLFAARRAPR